MPRYTGVRPRQSSAALVFPPLYLKINILPDGTKKKKKRKKKQAEASGKPPEVAALVVIRRIVPSPIPLVGKQDLRSFPFKKYGNSEHENGLSPAAGRGHFLCPSFAGGEK